MLKALRRNVQQLEGLVRKVLEENSNLQTDAGIKLERWEFDLWPLVEALIEELQPVAESASTQLINKVPDDLMAFADASLLKRVLQNLMANAINYTPHGTVLVGAREAGADGAVECWVSDDGRGHSRRAAGSRLRQGRNRFRERWRNRTWPGHRVDIDRGSRRQNSRRVQRRPRFDVHVLVARQGAHLAGAPIAAQSGT